MSIGRDISKSALFFLLVALFWLTASLFQDQENTEGSGLDIFLMIDCSRSVSAELQNSHSQLADCYELIISEIIRNMRDWHNDGDRILLSAFSDVCVPIGTLEWIGYGNAVRDRLLQRVSAILHGQIPDIRPLDRGKTDITSALRGEHAIVKRELEQNLAAFRVPHRTQVIIILTDGKNDPRGESRSDSIIIDRKDIGSLLSG